MTKFNIMAENIIKEQVKGAQEPTIAKKSSTAWVDALAFIFIFIVAQTLGGVVCTLLGVRMPGEAMTTSFDTEVLEAAASMQARFVAVAYMLSMAFCFLLLGIYCRLRGLAAWGWLRLRGAFSPIRLLFGYLLMWCFSIAVEPIVELLPGDQSALGGGGWLLVSAVLLAPLFEETLFRGYIAGRLRDAYGGMVAWIVSAVAFGAVHAIPSVVVAATFSGLVLSYYYLRHRSLGLVIMLHAMNNLTACFLKIVDLGDMTTREILGEGTLYWCVYALCALIALVALVRMGREMWGIKSKDNLLKE